MNRTCGTLLAALRNSDHRQKPFDYWLLEDILPDAVRDAIAELPFSPPDDTIFDGRRETNNTKRIYFTPLNQRRFAVCREVADAFRSYQIVRAIERTTGANLRVGQLRIEYCQDVDGFWLEPHVDIR